MKVYANTYNKEVKAYVVYADSDSILYHDADKENAVTAAEIFDMFAVGVMLAGDTTFTKATVLTPATTAVLYATVAIGGSNYYTGEKE